MFRNSLLLTCGLLSLCVAEVFYVTPSNTPNCLSPCHTLDQYAQNTSLFEGQTNISLVFLEGIHSLRSNLTISGLYHNSNISLLVFQGQGASPEDTIIEFTSLGLVHLSDIANIHLLNIQMNGSKNGIVILNPQELTIQGCQFLDIQQHAIEIHGSTLIQANILIQNCWFIGGNIGISIRNISNLKLLIQSCKFLNESTGIEVHGETLMQDSMDSILIQYSHFAVIAQYGIRIWSVSTLLIQHCDFHTKQHGFTNVGVYINNTKKTVIGNSTFIGVKQGVRAVKNTQTLVVQGCTFLSGEHMGIYVQNVEALLLVQSKGFGQLTQTYW